ncbi:uncharacterized protein [Haliotis cracherodii]|uniref:uncharacterized protein isoform X1 n=1 Tax=Haliotis cracherodii TaxID=6455 RepID=UPI0039E8EDEA
MCELWGHIREYSLRRFCFWGVAILQSRMSLLVHVFACLVALACLSHALADDNSEEINGHVREMIDSVSSAARRASDGDVSDGSDVKRDGQVLGIGGRCAWYNDKCSGWTTHCCDPWKCKYKKWTHRFSRTGGRCL